MRTNAKRGRPAYRPTPADRRKVATAAGGGMTHEEIAISLGICRNTLEKSFEKELSVVALGRRVEVLDAMMRSALKGNVAAQKAYLALTPTLAAPPAAEEPKPDHPKGKKEQAQDAAKSASVGTDWDSLIGIGANVTPIRKQG